MNTEEYKNALIELTKMKTKYNNKYPYNLGYVSKDGTRSFDCWNLIKAILNGYDINNNTVGYYQRDLSKTGDCNGSQLLKQCSDVKINFSNLGNEVRYLYMSGHAGSYIGNYEYNGKMYNVVECTGSWTRNVLLSWVDSDGTRRRYKGGPINGKWKYHAKMDKWLTYQDKPIIPTVTCNGCLPIIKKGSKGQAVKLWQYIVTLRGLKIAIDGDFGPATEAATLKVQRSLGVSDDAIVGRNTWYYALKDI